MSFILPLPLTHAYFHAVTWLSSTTHLCISLCLASPFFYLLFFIPAELFFPSDFLSSASCSLSARFHTIRHPNTPKTLISRTLLERLYICLTYFIRTLSFSFSSIFTLFKAFYIRIFSHNAIRYPRFCYSPFPFDPSGTLLKSALLFFPLLSSTFRSRCQCLSSCIPST